MTSPAAQDGAPPDIGDLHHVGHVVRDMEQALRVYRQLGFACASPTCPTLARTPDSRPTPIGAANTHADFGRTFVELATVLAAAGHPPADAKFVELQVPTAALPRVAATLERAVAGIAANLARFEGLRILVFQAVNVEATAARFDRHGVGHSGVSTVLRDLETPDGVRRVPVRVLEMDREDVPEGRLAVAEAIEPTAGTHPNGAVELVEVVLCVTDADLDPAVERYARYLGLQARCDGPSRVFNLRSSRLTILPAGALNRALPGWVAPALPAFLGYAVAVRDLWLTRRWLDQHQVPVRETPPGDLVVPADFALGANVVFRQLERR